MRQSRPSPNHAPRDWFVIIFDALVIPKVERSLYQLTLAAIFFVGAISSSLAAERVTASEMREQMQYRGFSVKRPPAGWYLNQGEQVDVGNVTTYTFSDLTSGSTYHCVVKAYNAAGKESLPSNEISFSVSRSASRPKPDSANLGH